jgi:hypothetical protein
MSDREAVTVVLRYDVQGGEVIAVFSGDKGTSRTEQDADSYGAAEGHNVVTRGYYEHYTRPLAPAEQDAALTLAHSIMNRAGYDVTIAKRMVWA